MSNTPRFIRWSTGDGSFGGTKTSFRNYRKFRDNMSFHKGGPKLTYMQALRYWVNAGSPYYARFIKEVDKAPTVKLEAVEVSEEYKAMLTE